MTSRELKERVHALTDAGEVLRARFRRHLRKWGFSDVELDEKTAEWDDVTENIDRNEGGQS